jgi:hypothetical protein
MRTVGRALARDGHVRRAPAPPFSAWTRYRDLPEPPAASFRRRWQEQKEDE